MVKKTNYEYEKNYLNFNFTSINHTVVYTLRKYIAIKKMKIRLSVNHDFELIIKILTIIF